MSNEDKTYAQCQEVVRRAQDAHLTIGTAESCTGGLVCAALTDVPGSSAVVLGGVVSYAVPVKESVLGVEPRITQDERIGVVSSACAAQMSEGARRVLSCDIAVSITGIAGPGGAEPGKPVGTVWLGVSSARTTRTELKSFTGSRAEVRAQAVDAALALILSELRALGA